MLSGRVAASELILVFRSLSSQFSVVSSQFAGFSSLCSQFATNSSLSSQLATPSFLSPQLLVVSLQLLVLSVLSVQSSILNRISVYSDLPGSQPSAVLFANRHPFCLLSSNYCSAITHYCNVSIAEASPQFISSSIKFYICTR